MSCVCRADSEVQTFPLLRLPSLGKQKKAKGTSLLSQGELVVILGFLYLIVVVACEEKLW